MPRYYFRGRVPMPVNVGGGVVISVQPKTEFEAPASAVAKLIRQKLIQRLPEKKVAKEEEKPKAAPAPKAAPKAASAPKVEEKKPESEEKNPDEKEEDSGRPNRGFNNKKRK